jgi:hypothetical protein
MWTERPKCPLKCFAELAQTQECTLAISPADSVSGRNPASADAGGYSPGCFPTRGCYTVYISRWKIVAGMLTVTLGGLATVAGQGTKPDSTKGGKNTAEVPVTIEAPALPTPQPSSPVAKMPPSAPPSVNSDIGLSGSITLSSPSLPLPSAAPQAPAGVGGLPAVPALQPAIVSSPQTPPAPSTKPGVSGITPTGISPVEEPAIPQQPLPSIRAELRTENGSRLEFGVPQQPPPSTRDLPLPTKVNQIPSVPPEPPAPAGQSPALPPELPAPVGQTPMPSSQIVPPPPVGTSPGYPSTPPRDQSPAQVQPSSYPSTGTPYPSPAPSQSSSYVPLAHTNPAAATVVPAAATTTTATKFRIVLRVGEGEPTFEVRSGDDLMLKVVCDKVDVKSPEKGTGLSSVKASGKVHFAGFGAEGTCDELSFLAGTGEVSMTGTVKIHVKDKLGRVESELSTESIKYKIDPSAINGSLRP